jgi:hypothetical protein
VAVTLKATGFLGLLLLLFGLGLYMLPTIIGASRKVAYIGVVFAINLLLGWTIVGWIVALSMSLRMHPKHTDQMDSQPPQDGTAQSAWVAAATSPSVPAPVATGPLAPAPPSAAAPSSDSVPPIVVRLACHHLEETNGDPATIVGQMVQCHTCGPQLVESVVGA